MPETRGKYEFFQQAISLEFLVITARPHPPHKFTPTPPPAISYCLHLITVRVAVKEVKTRKRVSVVGRDPLLKKILTAWIAAIERYTDGCLDNPWWYNERASLSILAGAAWSMDGWVAMEEFSTQKRLRTLAPGVDAGSLRHGRCDLYIACPSKEASFAFEAKQANQPIGKRADGFSYMHKAMQAAWKDSGDLHRNEADRRFAATFVVPTLRLKEICPEGGKLGEICPKRLDEHIAAWLKENPRFLGESWKETSYAYVFPQIGNERYSDGIRHFPGVILILEERYKANRLVAS